MRGDKTSPFAEAAVVIWTFTIIQHRLVKCPSATAFLAHKLARHGFDKFYMLIRLTHADTSARTMGTPEQSRSAPVEG